MKDKIKPNIYLCTTAPSSEYSSWSNIPYLLHRNLEKFGYKVNNCVMAEIWLFKTLFNLPVRIAKKLFKIDTLYFYVRTPLHFFTACMYSKYIEKTSKHGDVMVVQGFSYPRKNKKNKMILVGDWPSSYLYDEFLKRNPSMLEQRSIDRENNVIESADAIVTLFPNVHKYMLKKYKNKNIKYFGNVVNIDESVSVPINVVDIKKKSNKLLFIGQAYYLSGAIELIEAVKVLNEAGYRLSVDIVGISHELLPYHFEWLKIHGYLSKAILSEKVKYYELLADAKIFVNTTPGWNGFQATLEAMYFYTPIIVRQNKNLIEMFPNLSDFSYGANVNNFELRKLIIEVFENSELYAHKCNSANVAAAAHSWENFIKQMAVLIDE